MITATKTADKLAEMFTENTGTHMLDSGGANGRQWQRLTGMTSADFLARPRLEIDEYGMSRDMYHLLNDSLAYAPHLDVAWQQFDSERPDLLWAESLELWLDALNVPLDGQFYDDGRWTINTYNSDNMINGTFQATKFGINGTQYIALQIHGGADVRGGYTKPVIFGGDIETLFCSIDTLSVSCSECDFYADYCANSLDNSSVDIPEDWQPVTGCPECKSALV
jgi:hypothetical protein